MNHVTLSSSNEAKNQSVPRQQRHIECILGLRIGEEVHPGRTYLGITTVHLGLLRRNGNGNGNIRSTWFEGCPPQNTSTTTPDFLLRKVIHTSSGNSAGAMRHAACEGPY